jgi:hypothetical protein
MQETITKTKTKLYVNNITVLDTLLRIVLREGYSFNSSLEIKTLLDKKFNLNIDVNTIEQLWCEHREIEDMELQMKHLNLYQ